MKGLEGRNMKKFLSFLLFLSIFLKPEVNVQAEEVRITYNNLKNIVYNMSLDGKSQSHTVTMFKMGDRNAYCIEPGVEITNNYYDIYTDWSKVDMSLELKSLLEKIGYYGYDYPGHQTNYYYIAAQELIWRAVRPDIKVNWSTGINSTGDAIDVSKEKEEIMNLVNSHDLKPSFSEQTFKDEVGKTITLKDENHVLDNYDVSESKYHKILKDGDTLTITLNEDEVLEEEIYLTRKYYDDAPLLVYNKGDSQKLAALRITTDKDTFVKIQNEEIPQIIEVPNTGYFDFSSIFGTLLVGVGLALFKVH